MNAISSWNYPTRVIFGVGAIAELPAVCRTLNMQNPLLVTDPGLAGLPMTKNILDMNNKTGIATAIFSNIKSNPNLKNIDDGAKILRDGLHDGVIAFGGGSAIDAAKAIALMWDQQHSLFDFEDVGDNFQKVNVEGMLTVIAIPTTAGTGSEVGRCSVITDEINRVKKIIFHPEMLPSMVIADPALTTGLPKQLTAATGMDALAHNLEAFCVNSYHPMADGIALEGMRLIKENLATAVSDAANLIARSNMLAASMMGAAAFQKGLGAIHAISHPLGALYDKHHGLLNAILMPYVLVFNRKVIEDKMIQLARVLNLQSNSFSAVLDWILALREKIQIPHTLMEIGIDDRDIELIAMMAEQDATVATNPCRVSKEQLQKICLRAINGL